MAATPAITALERAGVPHEVHRYDHDSGERSFGDEAVAVLADRLGVAAGQIFKTLVVRAEGGELGRPTLAVAVLPVPDRLSLKATAAALGAAKAALAEERAVTRATGYVLGGVSPVGQRNALPTVVDGSARSWPQILCSGGRRGLEIALTPDDLIAVTGAVVADITA